MTTIVLVENPTFYQKETSVAHDGYIVIRRFTFDKNTKCSLLDGTPVKPEDTLEGSLEGWYECRLLLAQNTTPDARISKYTKDTGTLRLAMGLSVFLAFGALLVGR